MKTLKMECLKRGIKIDPLRQYPKFELIQLLVNNSIFKLFKENVLRNIELVKDYIYPTLFVNIGDLKLKDQQEVLYSPEWIAERNFTGYRVFIVYSPKESFSIFAARDRDSKTFLPVDISNYVQIEHNGQLKNLKSFLNMFDFEFVLDGVITSPLFRVSLDFLQKKNQVVRLMRHAYNINVVDVLFWKKNLIKKHYIDRRELLEDLFQYIRDKKVNFNLSMIYNEDKIEIYQEEIEREEDGLVFRNARSSYLVTGSRHRKRAVKWKNGRQIGVGLVRYVFISGYYPYHRKFEPSVRGIQISGYVENNGELLEKHIGDIWVLPNEIMDDIVEYDDSETMQYRLKKSCIGKVIEADLASFDEGTLKFKDIYVRSWDNPGVKKDECII